LCQNRSGYDDGEIGGMIGRGNRSTRRKPAPVPLCPFIGMFNISAVCYKNESKSYFKKVRLAL
jgi:hypothetical protein